MAQTQTAGGTSWFDSFVRAGTDAIIAAPAQLKNSVVKIVYGSFDQASALLDQTQRRIAPSGGTAMERAQRPATATRRGRPAKTIGKLTAQQTAVFNAIPATGNFTAAEIRVRGVKPNQIGLALGNLMRAGYLSRDPEGRYSRTGLDPATATQERRAA